MAHGREEVQWFPDAIVIVTSIVLGGGRVVSRESVTSLLYLLQAVLLGTIPSKFQEWHKF